eukprot:500727-Prorocentrum_minimum.AAC.1
MAHNGDVAWQVARRELQAILLRIWAERRRRGGGGGVPARVNLPSPRVNSPSPRVNSPPPR